MKRRAIFLDVDGTYVNDRGVVPASARAAVGILQGLAYPAGRPQQLAQATLRVIAIRTALADAIAELGAA